jgi:hypothetical protein
MVGAAAVKAEPERMNDGSVSLHPHTRASEESGAERRTGAMETIETLVKTMESILEEREASQAKEKEAVESLKAVLQRMGYQIVPLHQDSRRRPKRGRAADAGHPAVAADSQGDAAPRRRGRPRKVQVADAEAAS